MVLALIVNVDQRAVPLFPPGVGPVLLWNLHLTAPVYFGPEKALSAESDSIPPLGSVIVSGRQVMFGSSLSPSVVVPVQATEGGLGAQPSPAQIADQIQLLGLMKDTTGQNIETNTSAIGTNTASALTAGIPPGVPSVSSAYKQFASEGSSPYILHTFGGNGRLWAVALSYSMGSNNNYPSATNVNSGEASLELGSGPVLLTVELILAGPNQNDSEAIALPLNGLAVASGDTVKLDVNGGVSITDVSMRASAVVLYSVP